MPMSRTVDLLGQRTKNRERTCLKGIEDAELIVRLFELGRLFGEVFLRSGKLAQAEL